MQAVVFRRRLPRAEREEQLLAIAEALFAERGFREPSMDEIAVRAGVTKPVLYDHFGSREGLVAACIRRAGARLLARVAAAVAVGGSTEALLRAGVRAFFDFTEAEGQGWFMLVGENSVAGPAAAAVEAIRADQADYVAAQLAVAMRDVDRADLEGYAHAIIGACERVALWRRERPEVGVERAVDVVMALVWAGLGARARARAQA